MHEEVPETVQRVVRDGGAYIFDRDGWHAVPAVPNSRALTAEEKWDKLRAHVSSVRLYLMRWKRDSYYDGFLAAVLEVGTLIHQMDERKIDD